MKRVVAVILLAVVLSGSITISAGAIEENSTPQGITYYRSDICTFPIFSSGVGGALSLKSTTYGNFLANKVKNSAQTIYTVYPMLSDYSDSPLFQFAYGEGRPNVAAWSSSIYNNPTIDERPYTPGYKFFSDERMRETAGISAKFLYDIYLLNNPDYIKTLTADTITNAQLSFDNCKIWTTREYGGIGTDAELDTANTVYEYLKPIAHYIRIVWNDEYINLDALTIDKVSTYNSLYDNRNLDTLALIVWLKQLGVIDSSNVPLLASKDVDEIFYQKFDPLGAVKQGATDEAYKELGDYPNAGDFYAQALWSAKSFALQKKTGISSPNVPITKSEVDARPVGDFGTQNPDLKKAYIQSLFRMFDFTPGDLGAPTTLEGPVLTNMPMDVATAAYALRTYLKLDQDGALSTIDQKMYAFQYKLQATMGLASGMLSSAYGDDTGTAVTEDEIQAFISIAYGTALSDIKDLMFAEVGYPTSAHLGSEVSQRYYYYLVLCYQEFAAYGTSLINILGPSIVEASVSFSGHQKDLRSLKSLYEALNWANDTALWEYWNKKNSKAVYDGDNYKTLKSVYDYLLSVNAFDAITNYDPESITSAFSYFFGEMKDSGFQLSEQVRTGILASASFLPMKTNLYDPYTYSGIVDTEWLLNFHAKFGYNRKALYIDTNVDAAVNFQRTGTRGDLRVCTLEDLLYADKDIVLYLDDNLYNVSKLSELTGKAFERLDNVDQQSDTNGVLKKFWKSVSGLWDISMENIAKTAEVTTYSQRLVNGGDIANIFTNWDEFFMPLEDAKTYLSPDKVWDAEKQTISQDEKDAASTYTPLTAFAVLSGVYQDKQLFNALNTVLNKSTPVFISSPTMSYIKETDAFERNQIFNYLLLKNLDSQMSIDYTTNLDMTSPIYMDLYGNIVTESGLVVIPSAANATLWRASYTPYNSALFSTYGDDFLLPYDKDATTLNEVLKKVFTQVGGWWQLTSVKVNGGSIDLSKLSTADKESLAAISEIFAYDLNSASIYEKSKWQMLITEVLRGAPIEHIDKDFEGLNLSHRVTKNGLVVAEKLEFLVNALSSKGTNTTLSIPNPAYMDGIEYVVFFAFKILILAILIIWMVTIYVDAVGGGINFRTGGKCIAAVVLVLSLIIGVPAAFELSYYQSNKLLLQDETEYLMMLNLEKSEAGQEIGITSIHEPDTNTTLYLKLADIEIPWYDLLPRIIISSTTKNLEAMYKEYEGQHPIASAKDVTVLNDAVYISTSQLFDSSTISFSPTVKTLYQHSTGDTPASYYTPYYYFLDQLIYKANQFAIDNDYYSYTTKIQRGGRLKTLGYIQPYFLSEEFMEDGMDYFGLYTLYDVTPPRQYVEAEYKDEIIDSVRDSQWCNMLISENARIKRIEKLNQYCRKWVADHRELIGKVTDETFLKSMALACAMEHNRLFNTLRADNLEIYELSNEDLMRLSIADHDIVMKSSTMSYARFVYTVGGTPAVFAAALLTLVNFISSWVKPISTLLVFCITCISIFVFKLILRRNNNSIYGYITTILLMCGVNALGSAFLKLSVFVPGTGLSPTVCILIQVLVQCGYIYLLLAIIKTAVKDWPNMGFQHYNARFNTLTHRNHYSVEVDTPKQKSGWDYYNALVERQRRRRRSL